MGILDTTTVLIALSIVGGVLALYLMGAPLLVLLMFRKPAQPGLHEIRGDAPLIPEDVLGTFQWAQAALAPLGFEPACRLHFDPETDLMDAYALVMVQAANRDLVMVLESVAPVALRQIEFSTVFEDGTEINTNNGPQLPLRAVLKSGNETYWFPDVEDPAVLYRRHAALCSAHSAAAKRMPPSGPALIEDIRKSMREDYEHAARRGVFRFDQDDDAYSLTLTGAYRLAWPNMFPLNAILKVRRQMRDRRALARALGR